MEKTDKLQAEMWNKGRLFARLLHYRKVQYSFFLGKKFKKMKKSIQKMSADSFIKSFIAI